VIIALAISALVMVDVPDIVFAPEMVVVPARVVVPSASKVPLEVIATSLVKSVLSAMTFQNCVYEMVPKEIAPIARRTHAKRAIFLLVILFTPL
jgi:hypothetical protein